MIDFQNGGLESQVYELIAKMCKLLHSNNFPKFETKQIEPNKWHCTLSIPGVKRRVTGEGTTEVQAINVCAIGTAAMLEDEHHKEQFDPSIERSIFGPSVYEYFGGYDFNKEYLYRLIDTDIVIDPDDELCNKLIRDYATPDIQELMYEDETIETMSEIVSVRFLIKERKKNYC